MNMRTRVLAMLLLATPLVIAAIVAMPGATPAGAQPTGTQLLYGHDNGLSAIVAIDTATGLAKVVGPTGFSSGASGMATARSAVDGPGGKRYAKGTFFGVLTDNSWGADFVTAVDPQTGAGTQVVQTSRNIAGRGVAFGPSGNVLYVIESTGDLSRIDTITGMVTLVGPVVDSSGQGYSSDNLQWDPDSGRFVAFASATGSGEQLITINHVTARAEPVAMLSNFSTCTLIRSPNAVPGPGGVDWPEGTWFAVNQIDQTLVAIDVDLATSHVAINTVIGALGPESSGTVCGTAFTLPVQPPTPTPLPPTPTPITPECVCDVIRRGVPPAVVHDAMANPEHYYGWLMRMDPNKPASPANPPRTCLSLQHPNLRFHPMYNAPIWRVGCP